jgi:hypothetical protein
VADLSTVFTGIRFENPFLLASAPPTESESNIIRAYEAGWAASSPRRSASTRSVATAAMLDHAIWPNVIAALASGMTEFLERNVHRGWTSLADFRGLRRGTVVPHSAIARADVAGYHGGYDEAAEGCAEPGPGA